MGYFLTQEIKYVDKDNNDDVGRQQTGSEETHETIGLSRGSIDRTAVKPGVAATLNKSDKFSKISIEQLVHGVTWPHS